MRFKNATLELQFLEVHPMVRKAVLELDYWSAERQMPEVVVTQVFRTLRQQEDLYWPQFAAAGADEKTARRMARDKFSWHLCRCAVDIRNHHYSANQLREVMEHLSSGRNGHDWEILSHDMGHGNHLHIARRDQEWKLMHTPKEEPQNA